MKTLLVLIIFQSLSFHQSPLRPIISHFSPSYSRLDQVTKRSASTSNQPLTRSMQNLLPMRLVFVGASTPAFDVAAAAGLANAFKPRLTGVDCPDPMLLDALAGLAIPAFTGVWSWLFLDRSSCSAASSSRDTSEARRCCRLARGGARGIVEDCSVLSPSDVSDQHASLIPGAELLKLRTHVSM